MSSKSGYVRPIIAAVAVITSAFITSAIASGSMSPGGGQGVDAYGVGKAVFFKQVACATCAYAGRGRNAADAKALLATLGGTDSKVKLDSADAQAVTTYLSKRFSLTEMAGK